MRLVIFCCAALINRALANDHDIIMPQPCFSLNMVGFGPPRQAGKSTANKTPVDARSPVEKTSQPVVPAAAGELPHDAFSQFPPLSPQNQASLQKVDGDSNKLTSEASAASGGCS